MKYWLAKSEPETYSWDNLIRDKQTPWDGVRNYAARLHLNGMKAGDHVLFYHSGKARQVVGIMECTSGPYQDPTTDDLRWVAVDMKPVRALKRPVDLKEIKADPALAEIPLVKISRLSVMPLEKKAFDRIVKLSET